jgi:hypothetical protein
VRVARTYSVSGAVNHRSKRRKTRYCYPERALEAGLATNRGNAQIFPKRFNRQGMGRNRAGHAAKRLLPLRRERNVWHMYISQVVGVPFPVTITLV